MCVGLCVCACRSSADVRATAVHQPVSRWTASATVRCTGCTGWFCSWLSSLTPWLESASSWSLSGTLVTNESTDDRHCRKTPTNRYHKVRYSHSVCELPWGLNPTVFGSAPYSCPRVTPEGQFQPHRRHAPYIGLLCASSWRLKW